MKYFLLITLIFIIQNCSKPKIVYICGDHICVNKSEAEHYFEENLSLEVQIIDNENKKDFDLVKLNLKDNSLENKKITIEQNTQITKKIKVLNNEEIKEIKKDIKKKVKSKKIVKKVVNKKVEKKKILSKNDKIIENTSVQESTININNTRKEVVDICTIIEKCSIDEISKYLLEKGTKKDFPDITTR